MARNGISYSDVKQAIDEMQSEGLNPTIAGLRERLGTGSFTTISEHLKRWRSERQQQPMVAGGTPAPDNLNSMVQAVWQQAREDATKELESYKQEIQKTLDQAEEEKQQAIEQAVATNERNKWLEDKNNALLEEIRELEKQNGILTTKLENSEEKNRELSAQMESAQADISTHQQHLEDLKEKQRKELAQHEERSHQERQKLQSDLQETLKLFEQQLNEERKHSEASEQHWIKQIDSLRQQLKDKDARQDKLEKNLSEQNRVNSELNKANTSVLSAIQTSLESSNLQNKENQRSLTTLIQSIQGIEKNTKEEMEALKLETTVSLKNQEQLLTQLIIQTKDLDMAASKDSKKI